MADQKTNDKEFETYLEGKSPLSDLYHQSETTGPSKDIDNSILNAAKQETQRHTVSSSKRGYFRYLPMALAASLIVAIVVLRIVPFDTPPATDHLAGTGEQSPPGEHVGSSKATPEILLEKINLLVAKGEKKQAQQEYELFIELFPHHEIDFKRYPNIKLLKRK